MFLLETNYFNYTFITCLYFFHIMYRLQRLNNHLFINKIDVTLEKINSKKKIKRQIYNLLMI